MYLWRSLQDKFKEIKFVLLRNLIQNILENVLALFEIIVGPIIIQVWYSLLILSRPVSINSLASQELKKTNSQDDGAGLLNNLQTFFV